MINNQEIAAQIQNWQNLTKLKVNSLLMTQLQNDEDLTDHTNYNGQVTVSGLVIYQNKVLLIFHNRIEKWLQPGGHLEYDDQNLFSAAAREVEEETGLKVKLSDWHAKNQSPIIIDTHLIPAYKNLPEHFHHDFRYIFTVKDPHISLRLEEVSDFTWVEINDPKIKDERSNQVAYKLAKQFNII